MTNRKFVAVAKHPVTWILVADSKQAQVYTRRCLEKQIPMPGNSRRNQFSEVIAHEPVAVPGMKWHAESMDQYEIGRNKIATVFQSVGQSRSMSAPHIDVRDEIRIHFAKTISDQINQAKENKLFDRLVLVAPPKMLGELKKHLDAKTLKSIAVEMPKDFTHYEGEDLLQHLENAGIGNL